MKPLQTKLKLNLYGTPVETGLDVKLVCKHRTLWPPALMRLGINPEVMWRSGEMSQHDYQQIETWQKVCGLLEMGAKCQACPLAMTERVRPGSGRIEIRPLADVQEDFLRKVNRGEIKLSAEPVKPELKADSNVEPKSIDEIQTTENETPESAKREHFVQEGDFEIDLEEIDLEAPPEKTKPAKARKTKAKTKAERKRLKETVNLDEE